MAQHTDPGPTRVDPIDIRTFIVERYWPGVDAQQLLLALPRLEPAMRLVAAQGARAEHVGSLLMPRDQVVFSVFRAASEAVVREVNELADIPLDRISEVVMHGFARTDDR